MKPVVMDTGPLVAWLCTNDLHHQWATQVFDELPTGALACEAVLAEACHLVAKDGVSPVHVLRLVEQNDLILVPLASEVSQLRALMEQYSDAPMDLADACVVRLAELYSGSAVCTTDRHFKFFRKNGQEVIPLLAPFGPLRPNAGE